MSKAVSNDTNIVPIDPGQKATNGFGEQSLARMAETSSTALAEQAKAKVQARYIMALQRPRDLMVARQKLLDDCKRPKFAETAIYNKPVGEGVEGPSIRFAEAAARALGNIASEIAAIYDDPHKRIVRVTATDLESNLPYEKDVTIEKTIERSKPMPGRKILSTRKNSRGYDVFVIEATSDEILDKENALTSKALRVCLLRLVPSDILEEAIEQCYRTREGEISADPVAARKKMVDAFASLGISAEQLADYLGHAVNAITPEEIGAARSLYNAIKDKETTWAEAMDAARQRRSPATEEQGKPAASGSLSEKLAGKAGKSSGGAFKFNRETGMKIDALGKETPMTDEEKRDAGVKTDMRPARDIQAERIPSPTQTGQSRFTEEA